MNAPQLAIRAAAGLADVLSRGDVWRGDALARLPQAGVASGYPELDAELPGGGWPLGELTELLAARSGIGEVSLLLPALARLSAAGGWLALVAPPFRPHAPAWQAAGIDLGRLLVVEAGKDAAWCCEQLLAGGGFAAVLAWLAGQDDPRSLRRLQVAAAEQRTLAFAWRDAAAARQPSPAPLRLMLAAAENGVAVRVMKRRGHPMSGWRQVEIPRPGRKSHVMAGAPFPPAAARSAELPLLA